MKPHLRNQIEMPDSWGDPLHPDADALKESKPKVPRALALEVAAKLHPLLADVCERITVAGSVRRGKEQVGDLEILFVSRVEMRQNPDSLLDDKRPVLLALERLDELVKQSIILPRPKCDGSRTWGSAIRLASHCDSALPVDFFRATEASWFNLLVCRTGGARTNVSIASAALAKRLRWNPSINADGFTRLGTNDGLGNRLTFPVTSEEDVFRIAGLPFLKPQHRP